MADLFDLLQLHRTEDSQTSEGTDSIQIPDDDTTDLLALAGEVGEKRPQAPYSNLTAVRFRIAVGV